MKIITLHETDSGNPIPDPPPTTPHTCPDDYIPHWYGCYKFVSTPASWVDGEQACAMEGGHLSSVHAEAENAAIFLLSESSSSPVWLGFRKVMCNYVYIKNLWLPCRLYVNTAYIVK